MMRYVSHDVDTIAIAIARVREKKREKANKNKREAKMKKTCNKQPSHNQLTTEWDNFNDPNHIECVCVFVYVMYAFHVYYIFEANRKETSNYAMKNQSNELFEIAKRKKTQFPRARQC